MPSLYDPNLKLHQPAGLPDAPEEGPSFGDRLGGAFMARTFGGSAFRRIQDEETLAAQFPDADPEFNVTDHLTLDEMEDAEFYVRAKSPEALAYLRESRDRMRRSEELASAGGTASNLMFALTANFLDPTNVLFGTVGLGAKGATAAARVGWGAADAGLAAAPVMGFQATFDPDFSYQDAALATFAAGGFGSAFKIIGETLGSDAAKSFARTIGEEVASSMNDKRIVLPQLDLSAAALRPEVGATAEALQQVGSFRPLGSWSAVAPVAEQVGRSAIPFAARAAHAMYDLGTVTKGMVEGYRPAAPAIHTELLAENAMRIKTHEAFDLAYQAARKDGGLPDGMTKKDFGREVARAMNMGDVHPNPSVQKLAQTLRKELFEPMREAIERTGVIDIPGHAKGAKSYFPHVYDLQKLARGWRNRQGQDFVEWAESVIVSRGGPDAEYARHIAEEVYDKITSADPGTLTRVKLGPRGSLKERTLELPFEGLQDWLVMDAELAITRYLSSVPRDVKVFERFGTLDAAEAISKPLADDARLLRDQINADKTLSDAAREKKLLDLDKELKNMDEKLTFMFNELRGIRPKSNMPHWGKQALKGLKTATFIKSMPLVSLAQMADLGTIIAREGLARTYGSLLNTMGKSLQLKKTLTLKEAQAVGAGVEWGMSRTMNDLFDLPDVYGMSGRLDKFLGHTSNVAAKLTMLNAVTVGMKSIAAGAASTNILDAASRIADGVAKRAVKDLHPDDAAAAVVKDILTPFEKKAMAAARLTPGDLLAIGGQKQHFLKEGLTLAPNTEKWTDPRAMKAYRLALAARVERDVLTPTAVDAPMWAGTEVGKVFTTYKRFMFAAYHRIMVAGLQQRDAAVAIGAAHALALGAISLAARDYSTEGEVKDRTGLQWARDSFDRSGLATMLFEADAWASLTGLSTSTLIGHAGERPGTTIGDRFRQGSLFGRTPVQQVAGPLGGYVDGLFAALGTARKAATGEPVTEKEVHRATKMIPFRNYLGISQLVDQLETAAARHGWTKPSD